MKKNPKTNKTVPVLCGVLAVVLIVMSAALVFGRKHKTAEFAPPPFDATAVAGVPELFDKTMSNVKEVKARGANVLGLTTEDLEADIRKTVDRCLLVPKTHPLLQPSLNVVPLQIFSYYMALARGCDVDKPRNLAKSVTVE